MNEQLRDIIRSFRAAQDLGVATLVDQLGIPLPASNSDWAGSSQAIDLTGKGAEIGLRVYAHGYGVAMQFPGVCVDFDWGDLGEGYGFDLWRLWAHCDRNGLFIDLMTYEDLEGWVTEACQAGELVKDSHVMYLREERLERHGSV